MVQWEMPLAVLEKIAACSESRLPLRDIYRIVYFKYHTIPRRNKEVIQTLQQLLGYQQQSEWSLWKAVERALSDPRAEAFFRINVYVPVNKQLGKRLRHALGLDEVIVIPALNDPIALSHYLGMVAAQVFGPRLRPGQGLGFSGGRSVGALGQTLQLPLSDDRHPFRLYALSLLKGYEVLGVTAEGIVEEIVARHLWGLGSYLVSPEHCPVVEFLDPNRLSPSDLDWAFIEVSALTQGDVIFDHAEAFEFDATWARRVGIVAEMLFHPFCADGLPPRQRPRWLSKVVTVPLALLRTMVREGKPVIVIAGGREKALALLSVHRAQRAGGPLFNCLVTDEVCAKEVLHLLGQRDISEIPDKAWRRVCQCFLAIHWRFMANDRCRTVKEVAYKLSISRNKASRLLHEALHGTPPLAKVEVVPPVPEPIFRLDLEAALLWVFPLREARVVQPWDGQHNYQAVGVAAAQLVLEWLKNASHLRLGLGSGRVRIVVDALGFPQTLQRLTALQRLDIIVLESLTWPQTIKFGIQGAAIANSLIVRCLGDRRLRVRLYKGEADLHHLDGAVVEVGGMYHPTVFLHDLYLRRWGIGPDGAERIAGQILNRPFDDDGHPLPFGDLNTSPPLETFRRLVERGVPVIGICAARDEWTADTTRAALAAIKGRLINCLVTDAETAINLLNKSAHPV